MEHIVLWIDDDHSIVSAYQTLAELKDIDLIHKDNWEDGRQYLLENFTEITAIILDANCKLSHDGVVQGDLFLGVVTTELQQIFSERQDAIPWYILSAGTMNNFGAICKCVTASRDLNNPEWGPAIFLKDDIEHNSLFDQICKIGDINQDEVLEQICKVGGINKENNIVLQRHPDVFKYLGRKDYICLEARKLMLDVLRKLYHPKTDEMDIKTCGNQMRHIIEYLFLHANETGILPNDFIEKDGDEDVVNITESMHFLCGNPAKHKKLKLWDKENNCPFSIFNQSESYQFQTVLSFAHKTSHRTSKSQTKELFFGIALLLCHLITSYGRFIDTHKDIKSIQKMWTKIEDTSSPIKHFSSPSSKKTDNNVASTDEGKLINHIVEGCIECTDGTYHIGDVRVPSMYKDYFGTTTKFRIETVLNNNSSKKDKFPYYTPQRNIIEMK